MPSKCSKSIVGDAARLDLFVDRALVFVGLHLAGEEDRFAVDREGAARLEDVGALAHQAGGLVDLGLAAAGHDHDLDAGPGAGLERPRLRHREGALAIEEEGAPQSQQGPVEVGVDTAKRHR